MRRVSWSREAPTPLSRNGAEGRAGVSKAAGGGGEVREKEGCRQIPALSSLIPDFCVPAPEMGFEPIKSRVSRGLSPMEAWDGKRIIVSDMRCAPLRY